MRKWVTILATIALCSQAAAQQAISPPDRAEIRRVIAAQIEAFRHDDAAGAFGFAAPGIRSRFGDAARFLHAVRQAYPAVYRPRSFTFGQVQAGDGPVIQKLEVVGPDGAPALALYDMEREADGSWLISGCRLVASELQSL